MDKRKRVRRRYCSGEHDHDRHLWREDGEPYWCEGISNGRDNPNTVMPQQWVYDA